MKKVILAIVLSFILTSVVYAGSSRKYKTIYSSQAVSGSSSSSKAEILASRIDTTNMKSCGFYLKQTGASSVIDVELLGGITESGYYSVGTGTTLWVDDHGPGVLISYPASTAKPEIKYWFFKLIESSGNAAVVDFQLTYTNEY